MRDTDEGSEDAIHPCSGQTAANCMKVLDSVFSFVVESKEAVSLCLDSQRGLILIEDSRGGSRNLTDDPVSNKSALQT
jgi:hypothetical protein